MCPTKCRRYVVSDLSIQKVVVANRGEIALRIIRAAKELGIKSVAVYSEPDRDSLPVIMADEAYCIGPGPSIESYLNIANIISVAMVSGADAIHPGYGFLAENPYFAEICSSHGIKFIGPGYEIMSNIGNKVIAKQLMAEHGLNVIPGTPGIIHDVQEAEAFVSEYGFPVMIKAAAGGGGKGMRIAYDRDELAGCIKFAQAEAEAAFGVPGVYLERYFAGARHVEVQVLVDERGHSVQLGERDCSVQRGHQKLIEESPSPVLNDSIRRAMGRAALVGAEAIGYTNAGTVEFLVDAEGTFYFLEMNTRIQVEHPVTEFITGIDIVKAQFIVASGEELPFSQGDVNTKGHALECRICAEDPERSFMPMPGHVNKLVLPGGPWVRVDTALYPGCYVPPYYDSLIAKVVAWGNDRDEATRRMARALDEFIIEGIATNLEFQRRLIASSEFRKAEIYCDNDVLALVFGNAH
jgi:acetyl-CoA carboxylase biotin carboxylase subunit